ncbi:MAG: EI24 domain-containing protein [Planctomycetes bacterium]|nr:EI24 domain-containing protein [Planctomycetota bacterium]
MLLAFARALGQLLDGRILALIGGCVLLSLATFVGAWFAMHWVLSTLLAGWETTGTIVDWLGGLATIVAAWFLFPLVTSAFVGLFLESAARAVEARHYPGLGPAPGLPLLTGIGASVRFLAVVLGANALLLVLAVFFPIAYPVAYLLVNGFLVGREYFELVALRRLRPDAVRALRLEHQGEVIAAGVVFAIAFAVPFLNLVMPIVATATMVHLFETWRRPRGDQAVGG